MTLYKNLVLSSVLLIGVLSGASAPPAQAKITRIVLTSSSCLGVCPAYTLVLADGCAHLDGESNFALIGHFTARIDDFEDAVSAIETHHFFELQSIYPSGAGGTLDAPTTQLSVVRAGVTTVVTVYGRTGVPPSLRELMHVIDGFGLTAYWFNDETGKPVSTRHIGGDLEMVHPEKLNCPT